MLGTGYNVCVLYAISGKQAGSFPDNRAVLPIIRMGAAGLIAAIYLDFLYCVVRFVQPSCGETEYIVDVIKILPPYFIDRVDADDGRVEALFVVKPVNQFLFAHYKKGQLRSRAGQRTQFQGSIFRFNAPFFILIAGFFSPCFSLTKPGM